MTPKEKAKELVKGYYDELEAHFTESTWVRKEASKQCALIAVDEIIKNIGSKLSLSMYYNNGYWQEVKQEIEQL